MSAHANQIIEKKHTRHSKSAECGDNILRRRIRVEQQTQVNQRLENAQDMNMLIKYSRTMYTIKTSLIWTSNTYSDLCIVLHTICRENVAIVWYATGMDERQRCSETIHWELKLRSSHAVISTTRAHWKSWMKSHANVHQKHTEPNKTTQIKNYVLGGSIRLERMHYFVRRHQGDKGKRHTLFMRSAA